jgi:hypothetical protein
METINHEQCVAAIKATGHEVTYLVTGEPGIGKSDLLKRLARALPGHEPIYADCPTLDVPDIQLPYVEAGTSRFATNAMWGGDNSRPKLVMLDELPKSSNTTRLLFTRLLLDRVIGAYALPAGSIVFATGNRTVDGVGDSFPAHMNNRVTSLSLAKPTADQWITWGQEAGIDPVMLAWVNQFPHALDPAGSPQNPYVFDPKTRADRFVSPRSLAKASSILKQRNGMGRATAHAALSGTLGQTAAADLAAYIDLADQLPPWQAVMAGPTTAAIPQSVPAQLIMAYGASDMMRRADKKAAKTVADALAAYFERFPLEVCAVAFTAMLQANALSATSKLVQGWASQNNWALR